MRLSNLTHGVLIRRYKRFLADIQLDSGDVVTAHCTNSGSMLSCIEEGAEVFLSPSNNPNRRTRFTWEMIRIGDNWVGVNTSNPNKIAFEWIKQGIIPGFQRYKTFRREVVWGNNRIDIMTENESEKCFVEVKNVTLKDSNVARFPDAVTIRGQKHLETLIEIKKEGIRAVMLFIVQRVDVDTFAPAWDIDPKYSELLVKAFNEGVEVLPFQVKVSPLGFEAVGMIPFDLCKR